MLTAVPYPEHVVQEVFRMRDRDQEARFAVIAQRRDEPSAPLDQATLGAGQEIDRLHTARLSQILDAHGWPSILRDGAELAAAVWLLVQHADLDPVFQRRCLDRMGVACERDDADRKLWAMLTDRVLLAETGEQVYGTQWIKDAASREYVPRPLVDPDTVDQRRAAVGLDTLAGNKRRIDQMYGLPD